MDGTESPWLALPESTSSISSRTRKQCPEIEFLASGPLVHRPEETDLGDRDLLRLPEDMRTNPPARGAHQKSCLRPSALCSLEVIARSVSHQTCWRICRSCSHRRS